MNAEHELYTCEWYDDGFWRIQGCAHVNSLSQAYEALSYYKLSAPHKKWRIGVFRREGHKTEQLSDNFKQQANI